MMIFGFVLSLLTRGAIDYSPDCNRPWVVDFRSTRRYPGRGKTLIEAARRYFMP